MRITNDSYCHSRIIMVSILFLSLDYIFVASIKAEDVKTSNTKLEDKVNEIEDSLSSLAQSLEKEIQDTLIGINTKIEGLNKKIDDNTNTITTISKEAILSSDRTFNKVTWIVGIGTLIITAVAGFIGLIAYREKNLIDKLKDDAYKQLTTIMDKGAQIDSELNTIKSDFNNDINEIKTDFERFQTNKESEFKLSIAKDFIVSGTSYREGLRIILDIIKNEYLDSKVKALAYAYKGYALKRLNRPAEATSALEEAINLDPSNPAYFVNCACYKALIENTGDTISCIKSAFEKLPTESIDVFKRMLGSELGKIEDNDFSKIKSNSEFKRFIEDKGIDSESN